VTTSPNFNNINAQPLEADRVDVDTLLSELQFIRWPRSLPGRRYSSEEPMLIAPEIYIEKLDEDDDDYVDLFADDGNPRCASVVSTSRC